LVNTQKLVLDFGLCAGHAEERLRSYANSTLGMGLVSLMLTILPGVLALVGNADSGDVPLVLGLSSVFLLGTWLGFAGQKTYLRAIQRLAKGDERADGKP
jgi:hypothetical protein